MGRAHIEELQEAYRAGERAKDLAERFGISRNSVHQIASLAGLTKPVGRMTTAEQEQAIELYRQGVPVPSTSKRFNRSPSTIWKLLHRRGVV